MKIRGWISGTKLEMEKNEFLIIHVIEGPTELEDDKMAI